MTIHFCSIRPTNIDGHVFAEFAFSELPGKTFRSLLVKNSPEDWEGSLRFPAHGWRSANACPRCGRDPYTQPCELSEDEFSHLMGAEAVVGMFRLAKLRLALRKKRPSKNDF